MICVAASGHWSILSRSQGLIAVRAALGITTGEIYSNAMAIGLENCA